MNYEELQSFLMNYEELQPSIKQLKPQFPRTKNTRRYLENRPLEYDLNPFPNIDPCILLKRTQMEVVKIPKTARKPRPEKVGLPWFYEKMKCEDCQRLTLLANNTYMSRCKSCYQRYKWLKRYHYNNDKINQILEVDGLTHYRLRFITLTITNVKLKNTDDLYVQKARHGLTKELKRRFSLLRREPFWKQWFHGGMSVVEIPLSKDGQSLNAHLHAMVQMTYVPQDLFPHWVHTFNGIKEKKKLGRHSKILGITYGGTEGCIRYIMKYVLKTQESVIYFGKWHNKQRKHLGMELL